MKSLVTITIIIGVTLAACGLGFSQEASRSDEREAFGIGIKQAPTASPLHKHAEVAADVKGASRISEAAPTRTTVSKKMKATVRELTGAKKINTHNSKTNLTKPAVASVAVKANAKPAVQAHKAIPKGGNRPDKIALMASEANGAAPKQKSGTTAKMVVGMIGKLILVCGLVYLVLLTIKSIQNKQDAVPHSTREVKLVDTVRLNPSSTVHVLEIQGKKLLIGCSANQISLLQEIEVAEAPSAVTETSNRFAEYLEQYSTGSKTDNPTRRIAGLLRDCTTYLRKRHPGVVQIGRVGAGKTNES